MTGIMARARTLADSWWTIVVIAFLIGTIIAQRWLNTRTGSSIPQPFTVGESLPSSLALKTPEGKAVTLTWKEEKRPTFLYIFQPSCIWCARNLGALRAVTNHPGNYRFVGLSVNAKGVRNYLSNNNLGFPVFVSSPATQLDKVLRVYATPETIIVSDSGKVTHIWLGAYGGKKKSEIEKLFGVSLPEIARPGDDIQATFH